MYVFILTYSVGMIYPYATSERARIIEATSPYRPLALAFVIVHCVSYLFKVASVEYASNEFFSIFAQAAYLSSLLIIAKELQVNRKDTIRQSGIFLLGLILLFVLGLFLWSSRTLIGSEKIAALQVNVIAILGNLLIIFSSCVRCKKTPSNYISHIIIASFCSILIIITRIFQQHKIPSFSMHFGSEDEVLFLLRILNAACFFLILNAVTNLHFQKLWNGEKKKREDLEFGMLHSLLTLSKARDNETGNHILRTKNYVRILAENLSCKNWISTDDVATYIDRLFHAAPLHDIGKVGIPDSILLKPGKLDSDEWEIMKTHALIGENVLISAIEANAEIYDEHSFLSIGIEIAGGHHENWDGSGYPRGLSGSEIPQSARLMAVADIYDALTSERPYKQRWSHEKAVAEIVSLSGKKLDPDVVSAFLEEQEKFLEISNIYSD